MKLALYCAALALGLSHTQPAKADAGDFLFGAVAGIVAHSVITNTNRTTAQPRSGSTTTWRSSRGTVQRGDAQIQRALNHFNFDAGAVDGIFGQQTRAAIRRFQTSLGQEPTGTLTSSQTAHLLNAYASATQSGAGTTSFQPGGAYGSLVARLDGRDGGAASTPSADAPVVTVASASLPGVQTTPTIESAPVERVGLCDTQARQSSVGAVGADVDQIIVSYCSAQQFALADALSRAQNVPQFDASERASQCVEWLSPRQDVIQETLSSDPEAAIASLNDSLQLTTAQQIALARDAFGLCFGVLAVNGDHRHAQSYAALIAAVGGAGFGEIVAGALALGYETSQNRENASAWFLWTAEAIAGDAEKLIDTEGYDHVPLLLALSDSALVVDASWDDISARRGAESGTLPALPGMPVATSVSLPGVGATIDPALANVLPADFAAVYGMTREQGVAVCREGREAVADLGRVICRGLGAWAGDAELVARYR